MIRRAECKSVSMRFGASPSRRCPRHLAVVNGGCATVQKGGCLGSAVAESTPLSSSSVPALQLHLHVLWSGGRRSEHRGGGGVFCFPEIFLSDLRMEHPVEASGEVLPACRGPQPLQRDDAQRRGVLDHPSLWVRRLLRRHGSPPPLLPRARRPSRRRRLFPPQPRSEGLRVGTAARQRGNPPCLLGEGWHGGRLRLRRQRPRRYVREDGPPLLCPPALR